MKVRDEVLATPGRLGSTSSLERDTFGRWSENVARFLGTGRYLVIQTAIVVVWITINVVAVSLQWDEYPFILLNLLFSTQAAYAAPLILLAQNRQDARDRALAERDREINSTILADTSFLSRELAGIRIRLEDMATGRDIDDLRDQIDRMIESASAGADADS